MPAASSQLRPWAHPDAEHHEVGLARGPSDVITFARFEALDVDLSSTSSAMHEGSGDSLTEVGVDHPERLRLALDDRRRTTPLDERLGQLQADVATAHHDDSMAPLLGRADGAFGVLQVLHAAHEREVDARQVGTDRRSARGDEQLVVAETERPPGALVEHLDLAGRGVDGHGLVVEVRTSMPRRRCSSGLRVMSASTPPVTTPPTTNGMPHAE